MKNSVPLLVLVICAIAVFSFGYYLRAAEMRRPARQAAITFDSHTGAGRYMVTARPPSGNGFLPTALADTDPPAPADSASESDSDRQIDDLLNSDSPAATFQQVYLLLKQYFVNNINTDAPLAHGAATEMLASLDEPNSRFVGSDERNALELQAKGIFDGTGAVFSVRKVTRENGLVDRQITVVDAMPGSPADKAGLRTGDVVTWINGHWIISYELFDAQADQFKKLVNDPYDLDAAVNSAEDQISHGLSLAAAQSLLDTTQTDPLHLTIQRPGEMRPIKVVLDASVPTQVKDIEYRKLADGNGYIVFNTFSNSTEQDFADALSALGPVKGLVVDLRDCSGGQLDPAVDIARALDPGAAIGQVDVRGEAGADSNASSPVPTRTRQLDSDSASRVAPLTVRGPISVLVNRGTANSAELLAAFLHDRIGARIVGSSTFGDGLVQSLFPLSDGSGFTLTTGELKTDEGVAFNQSGLLPEYALADPGHAGDGDGDPGMTKAVALLALGPMSPAGAAQHPVQAASTPATASHVSVALAKVSPAVLAAGHKAFLGGAVDVPHHGGARQ
jgi:carboxyl-terminal processing protease